MPEWTFEISVRTRVYLMHGSRLGDSSQVNPATRPATDIKTVAPAPQQHQYPVSLLVQRLFERHSMKAVIAATSGLGLHEDILKASDVGIGTFAIRVHTRGRVQFHLTYRMP